MSSLRLLSLLTLAVAAVCAGSAPGAALAPRPAIAVKLLSPDARAHGLVCGAGHAWEQYRAGRRVRFLGVIAPAPRRGAKVSVVVRRCVARRYRTVATLSLPVSASGRFEGTFRLPPRSVAYVQARFGGAVSGRQYVRMQRS